MKRWMATVLCMLMLSCCVSAEETVRVHEMIMPRFKDGLGIFRAHLGNDAGLVGAAKYYLDESPY